MIVVQLQPEMHSAKLRVLAHPMPLLQWEEELAFMLKEVVFYQQLLGMAIRNGSDAKKPFMYALLEQFAHYEHDLLPAMQQSVNDFAKGNPALPETVASFHASLAKLQKTLQEMKSGVFPLCFEMQKITIW